MKRLLKKKASVFGKEISVVLIALVAVLGVASAALVPYLGSILQGDVEVLTPMECATDDYPITGSGVSSAIGSFDILGGGDVNFETFCEPTADTPEIYGIMIQVDGPAAWEGEEFESVILDDSDDDTPNGADILNYLCYIDDAGELHPFADIDSETDMTRARLIFSHNGICDADTGEIAFAYSDGSQIYNDITITTNTGIYPGSYTLKMCYIADLVNGNCDEITP